MFRYCLDIAYRGTAYHGWQIQDNAHTVQKVLNHALSQILKQPIDTVGSGRTDTGVHARQQIVHMDVADTIQIAALIRSINAILPYDIVVKHIRLVDSTFHARYSAISRSYEYCISSTKNPFLNELVYFFPQRIDIDNMNKAAERLLAHHHFGSFCKSHSSATNYLCTITEAYWKKQDELYVFKITANRFLRGMVRAIVGTLLKVGLYDLTLPEFEQVIKNQTRSDAGPSAPASGLFLTNVTYPAGILTNE